MCGFAGFIKFDGHGPDPEARATVLSAMGKQLARRGPDDEQCYDDGILALVFRRLSIVDVAGGRQPFWNEDRTVMVAVNGEIYNHETLREKLRSSHRFGSRSDAEVVVHLYEDYGEDFVQHLNGMFAIMIWDRPRHRLLLVRDRLGIKPLHYCEIGETLLFGSELKALLAHPECPREMDFSQLQEWRIEARVLCNYVKGIHYLPAGHRLRFEPDREVTRKSYWSIANHFRAPATPHEKSPEEYIREYGELLADSVRMQLMSDVPVGLFLSGGIDSSLLAALAARHKSDLHCFTVVERGTVEAGDVDQAKKITDKLKLPFYPVLYDGESLLDELNYDFAQFEYFIWAMDKPRFHLEWLFKHELHRYARTAVPGIKVMLLGQGADEFAGGYSKRMDLNLPSWGVYLQNLRKARLAVRPLEIEIPLHLLPFLSDRRRPADSQVLNCDFQAQMLDKTYTLQRYNLWHEDRTSASNGIEARVPFLDHRLVELCASVPSAYHEQLFFNKRIVREQLRRWLPEYPPDKMKVQFYLTGNREPSERLSAMIAQRVFPGFYRKYLQDEDSVFARPALLGLYRKLSNGGKVNARVTSVLLQCMAIEIFHRLCQDPSNVGPARALVSPSPLRQAAIAPVKEKMALLPPRGAAG
jgi:asparagine synthase (glutamine-hydrolysing)